MKKTDFIIEVNDSKFGWCLLCTTMAKNREEAERVLEGIEAGKVFSWPREKYPTEEFRVKEVPHDKAWWTHDNWIG